MTNVKAIKRRLSFIIKIDIIYLVMEYDNNLKNKREYQRKND